MHVPSDVSIAPASRGNATAHAAQIRPKWPPAHSCTDVLRGHEHAPAQDAHLQLVQPRRERRHDVPQEHQCGHAQGHDHGTEHHERRASLPELAPSGRDQAVGIPRGVTDRDHREHGRQGPLLRGRGEGASGLLLRGRVDQVPPALALAIRVSGLPTADPCGGCYGDARLGIDDFYAGLEDVQVGSLGNQGAIRLVHEVLYPDDAVARAVLLATCHVLALFLVVHLLLQQIAGHTPAIHEGDLAPRQGRDRLALNHQMTAFDQAIGQDRGHPGTERAARLAVLEYGLVRGSVEPTGNLRAIARVEGGDTDLHRPSQRHRATGHDDIQAIL
mmetsp:Transcript_47899/g.128316  ORF Transcript_47899/g.128316 Transcript_47899/m.128316 type:complete len:330 (+) Transcript_47899:2-991(+)